MWGVQFFIGHPLDHNDIYRNLEVKFIIFTADINECQENTSRCSQECNNTIGGYKCYCKDGYRLANDNHTCEGKTKQEVVPMIISRQL